MKQKPTRYLEAMKVDFFDTLQRQADRSAANATETMKD